MKAVKFLAIVFLGIIIYSCDDFLENRDQLIMGEESGMEITNYNEMVHGNYNATQDFPIDIDNNGVADFQISCEIWGSPAVGQHPRSYIQSLNQDFQLYGAYSNDTVFHNFTINYVEDPNAFYTLIHAHKYSCSRIDNKDSIISVSSSFKTPPLIKGSTISIEHTFKSEKALFIDDSYTFPPSSYTVNSVTVIGVFTSYYRECHNFPIGSFVYIGIKNNKKSKMGWIKFIFIDENSLLLLETAIQK